MSISLTELGVLYLGGGIITGALCWLYDRIVLALQGYYDELPVTFLGYLIQVIAWPLILVGRTLALPWQLWVAYEAGRSRRGE